MRFGLLQVALGLTLCALGMYLGGVFWALLWPGLSVLVVGLGYLGIGPRVFGKRAHDGRLTTWMLPLLLPYIVVAWALWQLKSRVFGERPHDEVVPGILVGRRPLSMAELPAGVRVVVDLTSELPRSDVTATVPRYLCLPTLDTAVPSDAELHALLDALEHEEGPIFFHCAMGHGRSATLAAALMVRRGIASDVDHAIALMKARRPGVHLHAVQRAAVVRLHRALAEARDDDSGAVSEAAGPA